MNYQYSLKFCVIRYFKEKYSDQGETTLHALEMANYSVGKRPMAELLFLAL